MTPKEKSGQESAFPSLEYNESGYGNAIVIEINGEKQFIPFEKGMSKRFYAACEAMKIDSHLFPQSNLTDKDMIEDKDGRYIKTKQGYYAVPHEWKDTSNKTKYSIKTSDIHRFVRTCYEIADEVLKQENM